MCKFVVCFFFIRPPERRHGYEQQFHSIAAQSEHEALEAKRPRMETIAEAHITRTPPTAGGIVLPITHTVQDSLRATVEVKKVGPVPLFNFFVQNKTFIFFLICLFFPSFLVLRITIDSFPLSDLKCVFVCILSVNLAQLFSFSLDDPEENLWLI